MVIEIFFMLAGLGLCVGTASRETRLNRELESLYRSHVISHYLSKEGRFLNSIDTGDYEEKNSNKRNVIDSQDNFFHYDGLKDSRDQTVNKSGQDKFGESNSRNEAGVVTIPPKQNPYTYAVTATAVTPAGPYSATPTQLTYNPSPTPLPYHASPTPIQYHVPPSPIHNASPKPMPDDASPTYPPYFANPTPAPYHASPMPTTYYETSTPNIHHVSPTPIPYQNNQYLHGQNSSFPFFGIKTKVFNHQTNTPAATHGSKSPHANPVLPPFNEYHVSYSHLTKTAEPLSLSAKYHTSPSSYFSPNSLPDSFSSTKLHPLYPRPISYSNKRPFYRSPTAVTQLKFRSRPSPLNPISQASALSIAALPATPVLRHQLLKKHMFTTNFTSHINLLKPHPRPSVLHRPAIQFQDEPRKFYQVQQQKQSLQQNNFIRQDKAVSQTIETSMQSVEQLNFVDKHSTVKSDNQQHINIPITQQTKSAPTEQIILPEEPRSIPTALGLPITKSKPQSDKIVPTNQKQLSLFQSINKLAPQRPAHGQIVDLSLMKHLAKEDALERLMNIAGDDWDAEIGIQKNLLDSSGKSNFHCPSFEGHFPDPVKCSVYYQCSSGTPTKNTCMSGLHWNLLTNQCDWEDNVDCSLNKKAGHILQ